MSSNPITRNIPNFFTCLNLFCGCLGIFFAFNGSLIWGSYMIGAAALFDFLDGFAARILRVKSEMGKQLDSLADMVTFGVLPGMMMFLMISNDGHIVNDSVMRGCFSGILVPNFEMAVVAFLIPVFSALRLAKFNIDERQADSFIGLPTPANAIFIGSIPLILAYHFGIENFGIIEMDALPPTDYSVHTVFNVGFMREIFLNSTLLTVLSVVLSLLLVSPLPLFSLKFKSFAWKGNEIRYLFLIGGIILQLLFRFAGIPMAVMLYILISVVDNLLKKRSA